jgi:hypothetical protein
MEPVVVWAIDRTLATAIIKKKARHVRVTDCLTEAFVMFLLPKRLEGRADTPTR